MYHTCTNTLQGVGLRAEEEIAEDVEVVEDVVADVANPAPTSESSYPCLKPIRRFVHVRELTCRMH